MYIRKITWVKVLGGLDYNETTSLDAVTVFISLDYEVLSYADELLLEDIYYYGY